MAFHIFLKFQYFFPLVSLHMLLNIKYNIPLQIILLTVDILEKTDCTLNRHFFHPNIKYK